MSKDICKELLPLIWTDLNCVNSQGWDPRYVHFTLYESKYFNYSPLLPTLRVVDTLWLYTQVLNAATFRFTVYSTLIVSLPYSHDELHHTALQMTSKNNFTCIILPYIVGPLKYFAILQRPFRASIHRRCSLLSSVPMLRRW